MSARHYAVNTADVTIITLCFDLDDVIIVYHPDI